MLMSHIFRLKVIISLTVEVGMLCLLIKFEFTVLQILLYKVKMKWFIYEIPILKAGPEIKFFELMKRQLKTILLSISGLLSHGLRANSTFCLLLR